MRNYSDDEKKLIIWPNGKKVDSTFEITINHYTNTLNRLKETITSHLGIRTHLDKILIFNYQGLEIDEVDLPYLKYKQVLYVSYDGGSFNVLNYVNEYNYVKAIKSGGYGQVYLAKHVLYKDYYVAIKKNDIGNLSTDELFNISRESLYLMSFTHKNIIKYINSYIYEHNFYTIMDYAKGGELGNYLHEKKMFSESESKKIFKQLHDAVKYIHDRNVIHRDLKPNNILFLDSNRENLVLIDFGISGYNSGNIKETIKAGTTKFMPPECASGFNYASSPKFDIWALGVILYLMLFGQFPFEAKNENEIINKIVKEPHKFPSNVNISNSAIKLLNGLLEKNAQFRIELNDSAFEEWYNDIGVIVHKMTENSIEDDYFNKNLDNLDLNEKDKFSTTNNSFGNVKDTSDNVIKTGSGSESNFNINSLKDKFLSGISNLKNSKVNHSKNNKSITINKSLLNSNNLLNKIKEKNATIRSSSIGMSYNNNIPNSNSGVKPPQLNSGTSINQNPYLKNSTIINNKFMSPLKVNSNISHLINSNINSIKQKPILKTEKKVKSKSEK